MNDKSKDTLALLENRELRGRAAAAATRRECPRFLNPVQSSPATHMQVRGRRRRARLRTRKPAWSKRAIGSGGREARPAIRPSPQTPRACAGLTKTTGVRQSARVCICVMAGCRLELETPPFPASALAAASASASASRGPACLPVARLSRGPRARTAGQWEGLEWHLIGVQFPCAFGWVCICA